MASGKHFLFFSFFFSFIHSFFIFPLGIIIKVSTHRQKPRIFAFLFATSQACQTYINIGRGKLIAHRPPFFFSYSRHNNNPTSFSLLLLLLLLLYFSVFSTYHICIFTFYFIFDNTRIYILPKVHSSAVVFTLERNVNEPIVAC